MIFPTHPLAITVVIILTVFQASFSYAFFVRDADGAWRSVSWEKRSNPGDLLKLPLVNNNDKSYSVSVRMGTPFQDISMAVSLSQNYIVVASSASAGQPGFYNSLASSTAIKETSQSTSISGLDSQPVDVNFIEESCQILDFNYTASLAITPPTAMGNVYPDGTHGILGYGADVPNGSPQNSTLLGVYLPPNITAAECGIELGRAADGNKGGFLTMGGRDSSAFTGDFTSMEVPPAKTVTRQSWSVPLDQVIAGITGKIDSIAFTQGLASVDPYYPTIDLPPAAVTAFYSKITNSIIDPNNPNRYTVPCNSKIDITLTFGGKNFTMDSRDAITKEGDTCFGTVQVAQSTIFRVGNPFLRNVYTIFGFTANTTGTTFTVGFADKAGVPTPPQNAAATTVPSAGLSICFSLLVAAVISLVSA